MTGDIVRTHNIISKCATQLSRARAAYNIMFIIFAMVERIFVHYNLCVLRTHIIIYPHVPIRV